MFALFESLFAKTFLILSVQLFMTYAAAVYVLRLFKQLYLAEHPAVTATRTADGELDLVIELKEFQTHLWILMGADIVLFLLLLLASHFSLWISLVLFTLWSVVTGVWIALVLLSVDENLGSRVLSLTAYITLGCALIGIYSGIDFSFLGSILFFSLLALLLLSMVRLFVKMKRWKERVISFFGVVVFVGYLLYDFNRLDKLQKAGVNSWQTAMGLAISIYLDVINLFLDLLDLLSD